MSSLPTDLSTDLVGTKVTVRESNDIGVIRGVYIAPLHDHVRLGQVKLIVEVPEVSFVVLELKDIRPRADRPPVEEVSS